MTMSIASVRFASRINLDMGGSGARLKITSEAGDTLRDDSDEFGGAVNVNLKDIEGEPTLEKFFGALSDKLIAQMESGRKFWVASQEREMSLNELLTGDPIKGTFVATAGQITKNPTGGFQQIEASPNQPAFLQNADILGVFRKVFSQKMNTKGYGQYLAQGFERKGLMFNDALAGVMAQAAAVERAAGQPLSPAGERFISLDVGSGIATSGGNGDILYTSESQNAGTFHAMVLKTVATQLADVTTWVRGSSLSAGPGGCRGIVSSPTQPLPAPTLSRGDILNRLETISTVIQQGAQTTFEDMGSMRGMMQQTVFLLKRLPKEVRLKNPVYQQIRAGALTAAKQDAKSADAQQVFDASFETTDAMTVKQVAWDKKWVPLVDMIKAHLQGTADPVTEQVMDQMYEALAALAANKVMEHKANKVYLQFLPYTINALGAVNQERTKAGQTPIENPLPKQVLSRMPQYLNTNIAKTCFDLDNGVQMSDVRNYEGTGYLPVAFAQGRQSWRIQGVSPEEIQANI